MGEAIGELVMEGVAPDVFCDRSRPLVPIIRGISGPI